MGVKESLGGSLVFRWVRESPSRATRFCISRGASRLGCVLVSFLLHATFVARNLLFPLPRSSSSARAHRPSHRPPHRLCPCPPSVAPSIALRRAPRPGRCPPSPQRAVPLSSSIVHLIVEPWGVTDQRPYTLGPKQQSQQPLLAMRIIVLACHLS